MDKSDRFRYTESMEKVRRFLAYYKPHLGLFILDLTCAMVVAAVDVAFPLVTQYILRTLLPAMTVDEQYALLASNGMLVKRPLLITEDKVLIGFKSAEWETLLK